MHASPQPWYYRNTIQFHLTREGKLGFQKARSNQTFAIRECHLPEEGDKLVMAADRNRAGPKRWTSEPEGGSG